MALRYGFYNSVGEDRLYDATELSEFFDGVVGDGVLQGVGAAFKLTANGDKITVGTGRAWFNKTWTHNDSNLVIDLPSASNVNNRIDTLVLQIDKRIEGRENDIFFVLGEPSSSPVAPTLTTPTDVYQYPLGDVYRARDVNTITQGNITSRVGTPTCPYATNTLVNLDTWDILTYKRSIVRGNHLGTSLTNAQKLAIQDGSFEGMYLGDYWTHKGVNWRIVDFDYWLGKQDSVTAPTSRVEHHHVVIIPDDVRMLYANVRPFTSARKANDCGWNNSSNAKNRCAAVVNQSKTLFGNNGILNRMVRWTTTLSTARYAMNQVTARAQGGIASEGMLYGGRNLGLPHTDNDVEQLALYKHNVRNIWWGHDRGQVTIPAGQTHLHQAFWTLNQYTIENWTCVHDWGGASAHNPSDAHHGSIHQIKPVFGITGR